MNADLGVRAPAAAAAVTDGPRLLLRDMGVEGTTFTFVARFSLFSHLGEKCLMPTLSAFLGFFSLPAGVYMLR